MGARTKELNNISLMGFVLGKSIVAIVHVCNTLSMYLSVLSSLLSGCLINNLNHTPVHITHYLHYGYVIGLLLLFEHYLDLTSHRALTKLYAFSMMCSRCMCKF